MCFTETPPPPLPPKMFLHENVFYNLRPFLGYFDITASQAPPYFGDPPTKTGYFDVSDDFNTVQRETVGAPLWEGIWHPCGVTSMLFLG